MSNGMTLREQAARREGVLDVIGDPETRAMAAQDVAAQLINSAPRSKASLLLFVPKRGWIVGRWREGWGNWYSVPGDWRILPTHWMPLPTPPVTP